MFSIVLNIRHSAHTLKLPCVSLTLGPVLDLLYCPQVVEDWKFISMVLDRFFLWVFTLSCIGGTLGIIFQSPSLYDTRPAIDQQLSEIPLKKANFMTRPEILRVNFD